jgi:ribonuclease PH
MRPDGRNDDALRTLELTVEYLLHAEGSCLISLGNTKVLCAASVEDNVPQFKKGTGEGWVSAEYSLLPRSTNVRSPRERRGAGGRTYEIQRTIGRVLRATIDLSLLGERTVWLDCDVIQADGGTRTAAITGAYVALALATRKLVAEGYIEHDPIVEQVAAISVGIVDDQPILDLNYAEDFNASVDMNVAMTSDGSIVELQGTAEKKSFSRDQMDTLLDLATKGIRYLQEQQLAVLKNER